MATKRLGKGLNALIRPKDQENLPSAGVTNIPISKIKKNPHQPRKQFNSTSLEELSVSIKEKGVITPRGEISLKNKGIWKTFYLENLK